MSISTIHSAAARQNGAQSHGPVSDEGKARSAQNARKHGLFGAIVLHSEEEKQSYSDLLDAYLEEYQPATLFENRCVREMVDAEWRLAAIRFRISLLEITFPAHAAPGASRDQAFATAFHQMASSGQTLSLALRYERHFQRQFEKAHHHLTESRHKSALDRHEIARRTDQAMAEFLTAAAEAPLPDVRKPKLQNEPKPQPPAASNFHNPTLRNQPPPIPNLYKG